MMVRNIKVVFSFLLIMLVAEYSYPVTGAVWTKTLSHVENKFSIAVYVDSGSQKLGAYQFEIQFDTSVVSVDTTIGENGIEAGSSGFVTAVNTDNKNGNILVNGFDVKGKGPGDSLEVLIIHFDQQDDVKPHHVKLNVNNLTDEQGVPITR